MPLDQSALPACDRGGGCKTATGSAHAEAFAAQLAQVVPRGGLQVPSLKLAGSWLTPMQMTATSLRWGKGRGKGMMHRVSGVQGLHTLAMRPKRGGRVCNAHLSLPLDRPIHFFSARVSRHAQGSLILHGIDTGSNKVTFHRKDSAI